MNGGEAGVRRPETGRSVVDRIAPGGPWRRTWLALVALCSALPSLVWAASGASFLHDDWWLSNAFARGDLGQRGQAWWDAATHAPARPGAATYYLVTYGVFGRHPVLHALALAAICAAVGILAFLVAERLWRTDVAMWIALVYAVLPNRGTNRLWFAVATYPLAVALLLAGVLLLLSGRSAWAAVLLALAVLTYEGVFGLALLAVALWTIADLGTRWRRGALVLAPTVAAGGLVYLMSPKRTGSHFGGFDRLMGSQFGTGLFESAQVARLAPAVLCVGLVLIVALPHPQRRRFAPIVGAGVVILLAGWLPFFATNWPIATTGFFDRANGVVGLGTAIIIGALLAWLVEVAPSPAGAVVGVAVVAALLALNAVDVHSYREAAQRGQQLLDQAVVDVPPGSGPLIVVPIPDAVQGVTQFPAGGDLTDALRFRRGDQVLFWIDPDVDEQDPPAGAQCYDTITRTIGACPAP